MPVFRVAELINIAIRDEETGIAFYKALASVTKNPEIKEHVLGISRQEELHAQRFKEMLDDLGEYKPQERFEGEYENYLGTLLEARAFPAPEKAAEEAKRATSDAEAIKIAMQLEKDTLLFLSELKEFVPDTHTEYVDAVIKEEREHLIELAKLRTHLK